MIKYWLRKNCKIKGDVLEFYTEPLSKIPIKKVAIGERRKLVEIVEKLIIQKTNNLNEDLKELELKIDQLVYELYGLTAEEIEIVEGI